MRGSPCLSEAQFTHLQDEQLETGAAHQNHLGVSIASLAHRPHLGAGKSASLRAGLASPREQLRSRLQCTGRAGGSGPGATLMATTYRGPGTVSTLHVLLV